MPCDKTLNTNCSPCKDCQKPVPPVMPRCDVALPDGVFTNATVTVEGGCIIKVEAGEPFVYRAEPCCTPAGGGNVTGAGSGIMGATGRDGKAATVSIGEVHSVSANTPPRVVNTGSDTAAVLDFYIPSGAKGEQGAAGTQGDFDYNKGGVVIKDGIVMDLPPNFPEGVVNKLEGSDENGIRIIVTFDEAANTATISADATALVEGIHTQLQQSFTAVHNTISELRNEVNNLRTEVNNYSSRMNQFEQRLNQCCGGNNSSNNGSGGHFLGTGSGTNGLAG